MKFPAALAIASLLFAAAGIADTAKWEKSIAAFEAADREHPPQKGGILRWADTIGLPKVLEKLKKYEGLGKRYEPTEQMRKLASEKKGFFKE